MIKLISDKVIDAYELLNGMSFEEAEPYEGVLTARQLKIKDKETEDFIIVYEIKENNKDKEKLIEYTEPSPWNKSVIKDLLCEYFTKYSNQSNGPVSMRREIVNYDILDVLSKFGYVKAIYMPNEMCLIYKKRQFFVRKSKKMSNK